MNEIVNKFLLVGDKFMLEMHLKQPGFTYSACGPFTKNKERIEKIMQTGIQDGYQRGLASMVYKFLDKNLLEVVLKIKLNKTNNLQMNFINQLLENQKRKVYSSFKDNILGVYYVQLIFLVNMHGLFV